MSIEIFRILNLLSEATMLTIIEVEVDEDCTITVANKPIIKLELNSINNLN